jgi:signal transduction histidine kinase
MAVSSRRLGIPAPSSFLSARLRLARHSGAEPGRLDPLLERVARLSAEQLSVERVGIWLFDDEARSALSLRFLYELSKNTHTRDVLTIRPDRYPAYFAALEDRRAIVADDARSHPATRELERDYFEPNGIASMLDAPIFRRGAVIGIVCHEHVGPIRTWVPREIDFAASVADMVTIHLEEAEIAATLELLRAQEQELAHAERLATVGVIARYVAHDLNNAVAPILMCAAQLRPVVAHDKAATERLGIIANAAEHGAALARRLLDVASGQAPVRQLIGVEALVEEAMPLLSAAAGERFEVTLDASAGPARVPGDPVEIVRILLNLVANARDAMPAGGTVTIRTALAEDEVLVQVIDTGSGMTEEQRKRLFVPFFTTKPGRGTGLGLAGVRATVDSMKGKIDVESAPGRGTTVTVRLPLGR